MVTHLIYLLLTLVISLHHLLSIEVLTGSVEPLTLRLYVFNPLVGGFTLIGIQRLFGFGIED